MEQVITCTTCGRVQRAAGVPERALVTCGRCGSRIERRSADSRLVTVALSLAALILFGPAYAYPFVEIDYMGHPGRGRDPRRPVARGALLVLMGTVFLGSGCTSSPERPSSYVEGEVLTARVENALERADRRAFAEVRATAGDGTVTLEGRVASRKDRRRAAEMARRLERVEEVVNRLRVEPAAGGGARVGGSR